MSPDTTSTLLAAATVAGDPPWFLTTVFASHLAVFGSLLWRRRQPRYALLVGTFVLLLAVAWLPHWGLDPHLGGASMLNIARLLAFALGGAGLVLIVRDRVRAWRAKRG